MAAEQNGDCRHEVEVVDMKIITRISTDSSQAFEESRPDKDVEIKTPGNVLQI